MEQPRSIVGSQAGAEKNLVSLAARIHKANLCSRRAAKGMPEDAETREVEGYDNFPKEYNTDEAEPQKKPQVA